MNNVYVWLWTAAVFVSLAWYGTLLFYVGFRGGHEIIEMTKNLSKQGEDDAVGNATRNP